VPHADANHTGQVVDASNLSVMPGLTEFHSHLQPDYGESQGRAFLDITRAAWPCAALDRLDSVANGIVALPVAVAAACAGHGIALAPAVGCYLHALAANLVSAGVRLIPLGQSDGQRVLAALEPVVTATAARALTTLLDEVASTAIRADLASMHHETQYTRLFRS